MQVGLLSSALEHATPEQMFSTETEPANAISAVKALSKANALGQRIYHLTRANMAETLPNLNLHFETEQEIQQALLAGKEVIAHTDNVSVPGWSGAGYVIFDPSGGGGAYKIAGGANGAYSFLLGFFVGMLLVSSLVGSLSTISELTAFFADLQSATVINGGLLSLLGFDLSGEMFNFLCFASGLLTGLVTISLFAAASGVGAALSVGLLSVVLGILALEEAFGSQLPTPLQCFGLRG